MKKLYYIFFLMFNAILYSQNIVGLCNGQSIEDLPSGSYIKDLNEDFDKFEGTWRWTDGTVTLTFVLGKIVHQYFSEFGSYRDYMIGNYSYTINSGNSYVVNTILTNSGSNPDQNPLYASCLVDPNTIDFLFNDVTLGKKLSRAIFQFESGSLTQLHLVLKNPESGGYLNGTTPYNYSFSIPTDVILTKIN